MYLPVNGIPIEFAPTILGLFIPALLVVIIFAYVVRFNAERRKKKDHKNSEQSEPPKVLKHRRRKRKSHATR